MFSPKVISDGMLKVSSISAFSVSAISVNKNAPRELRSWVNPTPSAAVATSRKDTGKLKAKRCPIRRSTPTEGFVMVVVSLPRESPGGEQLPL
jgi:hypothetical protein